MLSELGRRPMISSGGEGSFGDELEKEIGLLLREQRRDADDREKELNMYRSGSAPPTVEGSLSAVGGLFNSSHGQTNGLAFSEFASGNGFMSEDELRADPAYISYYYSNMNLNPRLPPPLLSKEDWRFTQRLQGGGGSGLGGIGDRRKSNRSNGGGGSDAAGGGVSLFSMPPGFSSKKQENEDLEAEKAKASAEWGGDGLIGLPGLGLGSKQKSLAEIFQNQKNNKNSLYYDGSSSNLQSQYPHINGGGSSYLNNGSSGHSINSPQMMSSQHGGSLNLPPLFESAAAASAMAYPGMESRFGLESPNMSRIMNQMTGNT